mgnify:CR=1 FL=1
MSSLCNTQVQAKRKMSINDVEEEDNTIGRVFGESLEMKDGDENNLK